MQYVIVLIFVITFFAFNKGFTDSSPLYTHFTYMFSHSNLMHLVLNSLAFIGMFRLMKRFINKYVLFITIVLIGFFASFFSEYSIPTVGSSSMVYALIGLFLGGILIKKISFNGPHFCIFLLSIFLSLIISFFKQNSNFSIHVISLGMGLMVSFPISKIR